MSTREIIFILIDTGLYFEFLLLSFFLGYYYKAKYGFYLAFLSIVFWLGGRIAGIGILERSVILSLLLAIFIIAIERRHKTYSKRFQFIKRPAPLIPYKYKSFSLMKPFVFLAKLLVEGEKKTWNWIAKPEFQYAGDFSESRALIAVNKKYGYIDRRGNLIIKPQFTIIGHH